MNNYSNSHHRQLVWIWNHRGGTVLSIPMRASPERCTVEGTPALNLSSGIPLAGGPDGTEQRKGAPVHAALWNILLPCVNICCCDCFNKNADWPIAGQWYGTILTICNMRACLLGLLSCPVPTAVCPKEITQRVCINY